ncbi:MAG TPA: IS30 family transposase [Clostridiales bacterium]|nr:IS30 family transposase [Clostridiales bacterium]HQK74334.1 IS30 family transposase [Clostridiales bacterium]
MSQEEYSMERMKRKHLSEEERKIIEREMRYGTGKAGIARLLHRDISTIKREIKRGSVIQRKENPYASRNPKVPDYLEKMVYFWDVGQSAYLRNRQKCGAKNKVIACAEQVQYVEAKILGKEKWSPDAAIGFAKANGLFPGQEFSTKTFYNWIDDGLVRVKNIDLLLKVRRKPKKPRRERKRVMGKSIEERPSSVEAREDFGHWEGDGMVGKGRRGHLISLVERKTGAGFLFNVATRESNKIVEVLDMLQQEYKGCFNAIFKTITFDNGPEFSDSDGMENGRGTQVYYAHPYSSYERGINENWNGIVRRFIPKGKSFDNLKQEDLQRICHYINTMPRKRLGYRTPLDLWNEAIRHILAA